MFSTGSFLQHGYQLPGYDWEYGALFLLVFIAGFATAHLPNTLESERHNPPKR